MNMLLTQPEVSQLPEILLDDEDSLVTNDHFVVDSLEKALWAASKLDQAQKAIDDLTKTARLFHDRIQSWHTKTCEKYEQTISYMESLLRPFLNDKLSAVKAKSINLPGYRVGLRTSPAKVVIEDSISALAYLEKYVPQAVVISKDVSKTALKPLLTAGELIPGINLIPGETKLYVTED